MIPDKPSFYVNVPSRIDPTAAPDGCDSIVVLVPVGHLLESGSDTHKGTTNSKGATQNWDDMVSTARHTVLRTIESRLHIDLGPHIIDEEINTPVSWKSRFNLDRGAILGLSHSFWNVLSFRPKTQHPNIDRLYFVGASTHPGTGVPIVLAGAKIVTEDLLSHWYRSPNWRSNEEHRIEEKKGRPEGVSALDKMSWMPFLDYFHWVIITIMTILMTILGFVFGGVDWSKGKFAGDW